MAIQTPPALAIFRFHGMNSENWEKNNIMPSERFRYLYVEDELAGWMPPIASTAKSSKDAHVLDNNRFSQLRDHHGSRDDTSWLGRALNALPRFGARLDG